MFRNVCLVLLLVPVLLNAQETRRCGYIEAKKALLQTDPGSASRISLAESQVDSLNPESNKSSAASIYTIPVVFHVLHLGGAENISDAQILDALNILNKDFNKQNADTANIVAAFQNLAANCEIEFKLATLDENGNCTTGITRHYDEAADWEISSGNYKYTWNRTRYLNVYVVKSLPPGIAAYTYLPNTSSPVMDAVVALHSYVGSIGTGNPGGARVLTHEVGHWLNLQHTWGSNNQPGVACGDDGVGDTPPTKGFNFCNLANASVCTNGVEENVQNYMEYAFCQNMFTLGQRNRMHNCLNSSNAGRINLWSPANLQFTGLLQTPSPCPPKADFMANTKVACIGDTVKFTDFSYNGSVTSWEWSSPGAITSSTLQNGELVFNQTGPAQVKLKISNNNGSDSTLKSLVLILPSANSGTNNLVQSFEILPFPDSNWLRSEPQYGSAFLTTSLSARSGSNSIWVNNFYDTPSEPVAFYTPAFVFQSFSPAQLSFYYAYTQKVSSSNDRLRVFASINCGSTWDLLSDKSGAALVTAQNTLNTPYFPAAQEFSQALLDLSSYANEQVYLKFEFSPDVNGPGNNFFVDDIMVAGLSGLTEQSTHTQTGIFPNPTSGGLNLTGFETATDLNLLLRDALGKLLIERIHVKAWERIELPVDLEEGVYFLTIGADQQQYNFKVVKSE